MFDLITIFALSGALLISPLGEGELLAQNSLNLINRQPDPWVNEVFVDNIVLNLRYMNGPNLKRPTNEQDWKKVREPFEVSFKLAPGETFAFQSDVLPEFKGNVVKTTNTKFNWGQGFRSSGWLVGDGVCHLASFINMTARNAGLTVIAPTNHNFAVIPDIPREFGTSIFYMPGNSYGNAMQNLYVINNKEKDITFMFEVTQDKVALTIIK